MQVSSLSTLLLVFVSSAVAAVLPADSGYVNIREKYGAKGDGKTNDTAAFAQAAKDNVRRLFIPRGVYLFSDTVHFSPKRWILQGEDEKTTVLRLADRAAGFDDAQKPKPFISTFAAFMDPKASMGQAFRSSVFNLTIEVGAGNPGAVALHYLNNNQGAVRDVTVRSRDPQRSGKAGLGMVTSLADAEDIVQQTAAAFGFKIRTPRLRRRLFPIRAQTQTALPLQRGNELVHLIHHRLKFRLRRRIAHGKWDRCHRVRIARRAGNLTRQRRVRHFTRSTGLSRRDGERKLHIAPVHIHLRPRWRPRRPRRHAADLDTGESRTLRPRWTGRPRRDCVDESFESVELTAQRGTRRECTVGRDSGIEWHREI